VDARFDQPVQKAAVFGFIDLAFVVEGDERRCEDALNLVGHDVLRLQ